MPVLYPSGLKLRVVDMMTLSNFVPAVYQDWYKNIIKSHKKVVADHQKKKKNKKKGKKRMKKSVKCSFENRLSLDRKNFHFKKCGPKFL